MSRTTRWAVALVLILAPMAGFTFAFPEWPSQLGIDLWNAPSLLAEATRNQTRSDDLDVRLRDTMRRFAAKDELIVDVIAGRINLCQASLACRELYTPAEPILLSLRRHHPAGTNDELFARHVIYNVGLVLNGKPERETVLARLNAELSLLPRNAKGDVQLAD